MVINYKRLNDNTIDDAYNIPDKTVLINKLSSIRFSKIISFLIRLIIFLIIIFSFILFFKLISISKFCKDIYTTQTYGNKFKEKNKRKYDNKKNYQSYKSMS